MILNDSAKHLCWPSAGIIFCSKLIKSSSHTCIVHTYLCIVEIWDFDVSMWNIFGLNALGLYCM